MASQAVLDTVTDQNTVPRGPDGAPLAFGLNGEPITAAAAVELSEDLERCTMYWTPVNLPDGRPAMVRTIFTVFDEEAQRGPVPAGHVPHLYATAVYTADAENRPLALDVPNREGRRVFRLWTYGSLDEAKTGHPEAVYEIAQGLTRVLD